MSRASRARVWPCQNVYVSIRKHAQLQRCTQECPEANLDGSDKFRRRSDPETLRNLLGMLTLAEEPETEQVPGRFFSLLPFIFSKLAGRKFKGQKRSEIEMPTLVESAKNGAPKP